MANDRREDERKIISLDAWWEGISGKQLARVSDISMGGCYIATVSPVSVGEFIVFGIKLPDGEWLQLGGQVVSSDPSGFSLYYTALTDEEEDKIRQLVY